MTSIRNIAQFICQNFSNDFEKQLVISIRLKLLRFSTIEEIIMKFI